MATTLKKLKREADLQGSGNMGCTGSLLLALIQVVEAAEDVAEEYAELAERLEELDEALKEEESS